MLSWIYDPQAWILLATLSSIEIVLGIDNIVIITILVGRLPVHRRQRARIIGLGLAMITRLLLLLTLTWIVRLKTTLFTMLGEDISGRDIIMLVGGLFLLVKSLHEIRQMFEEQKQPDYASRVASYTGILIQIALIDIIFSLDSVIVAVGMAADYLPVMMLAIIIAIIVMMLAARSIGDFVDAHPSVKMLALSFLILVGIALVAEGIDIHIEKPFIYTAIAFSVAVEFVNLRLGRNRVRTLVGSILVLLILKFVLGWSGIPIESGYLYVAIVFAVGVEFMNARLRRYLKTPSPTSLTRSE